MNAVNFDLEYIYSICHFWQTSSDTAHLLQANGYECESRGKIHVKGKGELETFFVKTANDGKRSD